MPAAAGPTFIRIQYHSSFGFHSMEISTKDLIPGSPSGDLGEALDWSGSSTINLETMILAYIDLIAPLFPITVSFDNMTVFTQATPTSPGVPQASVPIVAKLGTNADPGWHKATQATFTFRDTNATPLKFVYLDCASGDSFDAIRTFPSGTDLEAIASAVSDPAQSFASNSGFKPQTPLGYFLTINEKLRRSYRMT